MNQGSGDLWIPVKQLLNDYLQICFVPTMALKTQRWSFSTVIDL